MNTIQRKDCLKIRPAGDRCFVLRQLHRWAGAFFRTLAMGGILVLGLLADCARLDAASPTTVFYTGFEAAEGYTTQADLDGQNGWTRFGSGGNGVLNNFFAGYGQQAYIGFTPPANADDTLNVWRPINLAPVPANTPLVQFSVLMAVMDSSNGQRDDFRWSVYNTNGHRLFSLDFDGVSLDISYVLDDGAGFVATGRKFARATIYELIVLMDFSRNQWSATLDDAVLVNARPITTAGSALNLGDVDAVRSIRVPGSAGDNYLLFDEYLITAAPAVAAPPVLQHKARLAGGEFLLRLFGDPGATFVIDASGDLQHWTPVKTNTVPNDGVFDFLDAGAAGQARRFYRARQAP